MMALLGAVVPVLDWARYCGLTPDKQLVWEERGNELNKAMLYLMNLKPKIPRRIYVWLILKEI